MYNITETKNMRPVYVRKTLKSTQFKNIPDNMFGLSSDEFGRNNFLKPNPIDAEPTDTETFKALDIEKHGLKVQLGAKTIKSIMGGDTNTTLDGIKKEIEKTIVSGAKMSAKQRNDIIVQLSTILGKYDVTIEQLETIKLLALRAGTEVKYDEMGLPRIMTSREFKSMAGVVILILLMGTREKDPEALNYPLVVLDRDGNETKQRVKTSQIYNNLTPSGRGLEKYLDMELKAIVPRNLALLTLDDNKEINKGGFLNGVPQPVGGWMQYDDDVRMPPWVRVRDDIPPLPPYERLKMDRQETERKLKDLEREVIMENKIREEKRLEEEKREDEVLDLEKMANTELLKIDNNLDKLSQDLDSGKISGNEYIKQTIFLLKLMNDAVKLYDKLIYENTYKTLLTSLNNIKNTTPAIKNEINIVKREIKNKLATFNVGQVSQIQTPTTISIPTAPAAPAPAPATPAPAPAPATPAAPAVNIPILIPQPDELKKLGDKIMFITSFEEQKKQKLPNGQLKKTYYDSLYKLYEKYINTLDKYSAVYTPQAISLLPINETKSVFNNKRYIDINETGKLNTDKTRKARERRVRRIFEDAGKIAKIILKSRKP